MELVRASPRLRRLTLAQAGFNVWQVGDGCRLTNYCLEPCLLRLLPSLPHLQARLSGLADATWCADGAMDL